MRAKTFRDCPDLAAELHPTKNVGIIQYGKPINVLDLLIGTHKQLAWICKTCEHHWNSQGDNRVQGNGCPACAKQCVHSDGRNSMANTHPDLAKEYQGDANIIIAGTNKKLDWICSTCEHMWSAVGNSRVKGKGCPACAGRLHSDGRNSMYNTHPHLAKEYQGNANLIIAGTNDRLPWKCITCEHEWTSLGENRIQGKGCPACVNQCLHSDGRNSMANTHPDLAKEYQGDANIIIAGTNKKLDWICKTCEHHWNAQGNSRVQGSGCPACANKCIHMDGRNSMANTHPDLAKEYQGDADIIIAGTSKKLAWKCLTCMHEWKSTGNNRVRGKSCPACAKTGYDPSTIGYVYLLTYDDGVDYWLKCGITGTPIDRFKQLSRAASRANIEVQQLDIFTFDDGWVAQNCEQELLTTPELRFKSQYDIEGKAEFFKYSALEEIKNIITKYL
jgi:transposase-like protein